MKKYINSIVGIILPILTFIFYALPTMKNKLSVVSGYQTINFQTGNAAISIFAIFGIILLIAMIALFVSSLLQLLDELNVFKIDKAILTKLNFILIICIAICALIEFITILIYIGSIDSFGIGACTILNLIFIAIATTLQFVYKEKD